MKKQQSDKNKWIKFSKDFRVDHNTCAICGKPHKQLNLHHILPWKHYKQYRFTVDNLLPCCPGCHKLSKYSAESNAIWFATWLMANRKWQYDWVIAHM